MPDVRAYSLSQVSSLTGVPKQTLHAWEKRYGLLGPAEAGGGRRLYSSRQVTRVRLLRECVEQGNRIGTLVGLSDDQLRHLLRRAVRDAVRLDALMPMIDAMDSRRLEAELALHLLAMGATLFVEELIAPAMREVGRRWEEGALPVVAEHLLSASVRTLLVSALRVSSRRGAVRSALFATPEGEHHEIGLLAAALIAAQHGVEPVLLGTCVPLSDLPHAAARTGARAIVLGTTIADAPALAARLAGLRKACPQNVSILLGGEPSRNLLGLSMPGIAVLPSLSDLDAYLAHGGLD